MDDTYVPEQGNPSADPTSLAAVTTTDDATYTEADEGNASPRTDGSRPVEAEIPSLVTDVPGTAPAPADQFTQQAQTLPHISPLLGVNDSQTRHLTLGRQHPEAQQALQDVQWVDQICQQQRQTHQQIDQVRRSRQAGKLAANGVYTAGSLGTPTNPTIPLPTDPEERKLERCRSSFDAGIPRHIIEQKIASGIIDGSLAELSRNFWRATLADGVLMPNGERAIVTYNDLHHLLDDPRILRVPARIRALLLGVFEIRTAQYGRRRGLSQWDEAGGMQCGYVILETDGRVRTMHLTNRRKLNKMAGQGELLWIQGTQLQPGAE